MSRKRCIRKHYALLDPLKHVLTGIQPTSQADLNKLRLLELSSLEAFRTGKATRNDWRVFADALNVQESLIEMGVGPEAREANEAAQEALGAVQVRSKTHDGRLILTGGELQALREAYEFLDLQRSAIPRAQLERAIKRTADRVRSASRDVKVFI